MAHWLVPPDQNSLLAPQEVVTRLRAAFNYVDVSREEAVKHYADVAAHMEKIGGMPEFLRQEHERELPEAVRVIVADADSRQSDCPFLWFIAKPGKGLLLRLHAVWERDGDAVIALAQRC